MSTRACIGVIEKDGSCISIYHGHDSYPDGLGNLLLDHYSDLNKIREAISKGDARNWRAEINDSDFHENTCSEIQTLKELVRCAKLDWIEYIYLFDTSTKKWLAKRRIKNRFYAFNLYTQGITLEGVE